MGGGGSSGEWQLFSERHLEHVKGRIVQFIVIFVVIRGVIDSAYIIRF